MTSFLGARKGQGYVVQSTEEGEDWRLHLCAMCSTYFFTRLAHAVNLCKQCAPLRFIPGYGHCQIRHTRLLEVH